MWIAIAILVVLTCAVLAVFACAWAAQNLHDEAREKCLKGGKR